MKSRTVVKIAVASLGFMAAAAWAQAPQMLPYSATVSSTGPAALATTPAAVNHPRSSYVVAATTSSKNTLEITAWQDTTTELASLGSVVTGGNSVAAVAATGLDPTHVVTADADVYGNLRLRTWTIGGKAGVARQNGVTITNGAGYGGNDTLAIAALSSTQVVTALVDQDENLVVEEWTVDASSSVAPVQTGDIGGGDAVKDNQAHQVALAVIDSATVVTATSVPNNALKITTWGVDSTGVHLQNSYQTKANVVGGGLFPSVAIGAGSKTTVTLVGGLPNVKVTREAFTPIVTAGNTVEVIYWSIASDGTISKVPDPPANDTDYIYATAACMLPTLVPISLYYDQTAGAGSQWIVHVGWYGESGDESEYSASTVASGISIDTLSAAFAGTDFNVLDPYQEYNAYFATGALMTSSTGGDTELVIHMWSYVLPPAGEI